MLEQVDPNWRVMIVDDNAHNLELLGAYIEELGCETVACSGGQEAIDAFETSPVDLVILDVMMPKVSGFQVCEDLKAKSPETVVFLLTALNESGDVERGVDAGADDFLVKPVNKAELLDRVRAHLHVREVKSRLNAIMSAG